MKNKFSVKVITNSKSEKIEKVDDENLKVWVSEKPYDNRANKKVVELISDYLNIAKSNISIILGSHSKIKVISVKR